MNAKNNRHQGVSRRLSEWKAGIMARYRGDGDGILGIQDINPTAAAAPFSGMNESGLDRKGGREGIAEYLETKPDSFSV